NLRPHVQAGKLKPLAVVNPTRYEKMPELPTAGETLPGFTRPDSWFGFLGPANLPKPVLARLNTEIVSALKSSDVRSRLDVMGMVLIANSPEEFMKMYMD